MNKESIDINEISIRTELKPGDIGFITFLHGKLYSEERKHGLAFESYVAGGLHEFYRSYNQDRERVWICEHREKIIGCLFLADRGHAAQLRYYLIMPGYRGIGLGNKLMQLYMDFLSTCGYQSSFLWTTNELGTAAYLYQKFGFRLTEEIKSTAFGKLLREQRYDVVLKKDRFLEITNEKELFAKLNKLKKDTTPRFGKMTSQHMVEHLARVVGFSSGKEVQKLAVSNEKADRSKHFVLQTDKELPEGIMLPGMGENLPDLINPDLGTAIEALKEELKEFRKYFTCNFNAHTVHPVLGNLNYLEWIKFHNKHFTQHFKQFSLF